MQRIGWYRNNLNGKQLTVILSSALSIRRMDRGRDLNGTSGEIQTKNPFHIHFVNAHTLAGVSKPQPLSDMVGEYDIH